MPRKTGQSRIQYGLFATPLEDLIAPDNMVRVIDAFVDSINLGEMRFKTTVSEMGASSYDPELKQQKALLDAAKAQDPHVTQICLTDPDARMLPLNNEGMMQIAYNVQSAVDDKNNLIVDFSVENQKDLYLLAPVTIAAREAMGMPENAPLNVLADKGYHAGKGLQECAEAGITTYTAAHSAPALNVPSKTSACRMQTSSKGMDAPSNAVNTKKQLSKTGNVFCATGTSTNGGRRSWSIPSEQSSGHGEPIIRY